MLQNKTQIVKESIQTPAARDFAPCYASARTFLLNIDFLGVVSNLPPPPLTKQLC